MAIRTSIPAIPISDEVAARSQKSRGGELHYHGNEDERGGREVALLTERDSLCYEGEVAGAVGVDAGGDREGGGGVSGTGHWIEGDTSSLDGGVDTDETSEDVAAAA